MAKIGKMVTNKSLTHGGTLLNTISPESGTMSNARVVVVPDYKATFDIQLVIGGVVVNTTPVETTGNQPFAADIEFEERAVDELESVALKCSNPTVGRMVRQIQLFCEVN